MNVTVNTSELTAKIVANNPTGVAANLVSYQLAPIGFTATETSIGEWLQRWSSQQSDMNEVAKTLTKVFNVPVNVSGPYSEELINLQRVNGGKSIGEVLVTALRNNYQGSSSSALFASVTILPQWVKWAVMGLAIVGLVVTFKYIIKKFSQ